MSSNFSHVVCLSPLSLLKAELSVRRVFYISLPIQSLVGTWTVPTLWLWSLMLLRV